MRDMNRVMVPAPPRAVRSFHLVAVLTLPLPILAARFAAPHLMVAGGLPPMIIKAVAVLAGVALWSLALAPLRRRAVDALEGARLARFRGEA